jgi:hypothetical protein
MSECARPGCFTAAKSSCSVCGIEQYCGSNCQKLDWKIHKALCPVLKKLSTKLQPFDKVFTILNESLAYKKGDNIRVLEHLLLYGCFQFGKKIAGKDYRERPDGERVANWNVDINTLNHIHNLISNGHRFNESLSDKGRDDLRFPHLQKSLDILNPWLIDFDSNGMYSSVPI